MGRPERELRLEVGQDQLLGGRLAGVAPGLDGRRVPCTGEYAVGVEVTLGWNQTENDDPQPQVLFALGFLMTNWAPSRPSW